MPEILFRGKTLDDPEWVYGYYVRQYEAHMIYFKEIDENGFIHRHIYPETIGQYTGLRDRNGRKIFEGDILKLTDETNNAECIVRVEFGNPNGEYNWGFQFVRISGDEMSTDVLLWIDSEDTGAFTEVIGNIYDDPELLEGTK